MLMSLIRIQSQSIRGVSVKHLDKLAFVVVCLAVSPAPALAIDIEPGQWDMTYSVAMPMLPEPQETKVSECIDKSELTPADLNQSENPCEFTNVENDANRISWSMTCPSEMGNAEGHWSFESGGDSMSGDGEMTLESPGTGQVVTMTMTMNGRRMGDCTE